MTSRHALILAFVGLMWAGIAWAVGQFAGGGWHEVAALLGGILGLAAIPAAITLSFLIAPKDG